MRFRNTIQHPAGKSMEVSFALQPGYRWCWIDKRIHYLADTESVIGSPVFDDACMTGGAPSCAMLRMHGVLIIAANIKCLSTQFERGYWFITIIKREVDGGKAKWKMSLKNARWVTTSGNCAEAAWKLGTMRRQWVCISKRPPGALHNRRRRFILANGSDTSHQYGFIPLELCGPERYQYHFCNQYASWCRSGESTVNIRLDWLRACGIRVSF